jgi:hypothetical protein
MECTVVGRGLAFPARTAPGPFDIERERTLVTEDDSMGEGSREGKLLTKGSLADESEDVGAMIVIPSKKRSAAWLKEWVPL